MSRHRSPRFAIVCCGLLAATLATSAAAAAPAIIHTDTSEPRACLPLADGGALIGTGGGLVRIDATGARLHTWTAADGLPGTRIESVIADGDAFWIGADNGGARITLSVDGAALDITRTLAGRPLRDVLVHDGVTYAATWEGGVVMVRRRVAAVPYQARARAGRERVSSLASQGGTLWAGTAAGLYALRGKKLELIAINGAGVEPAVTGLLADGDRLWISTSIGLFVRDPDSTRLVGSGDLRRVTMLDGAVVTAGIGAGLRRVDRGRLGALPGAPALFLAQALASRDGAACAGGLDGLWLRSSRTAAWRAIAPLTGLPSNDVSALAADGDRLWVGTFDRGLALRDHGAWRAITSPDLDHRINALLVEPRPGGARLWVATAAGLMTVDGDVVSRLTRRDGLPGRSVMALARLRDGRIIAGTSTGAAIVGDGRATPIGPAGHDLGNVWAIAEDTDGMLWLGTTTGVWRGPATAAAKGAAADGWQRYSVATGHLHDDWVMGLAARDRSVWVGSYNGGVVRFDLGPGPTTTTAATTAVTATHVGDAWINPSGLTWDGDRLIAATQDGLRSSDGRSSRWTTEPDLPGKDVTAAIRIGTTRWIATRRGLVEQR